MTKIGNQLPTISVVLPYEKSYGDESVQLYNMSGNVCQEWQALMLNDIMAVNDDGLWVHTKLSSVIPYRDETARPRSSHNEKCGDWSQTANISYIPHTSQTRPTSLRTYLTYRTPHRHGPHRLGKVKEPIRGSGY